MGQVSKTLGVERLTWVQIPPPPQKWYSGRVAEHKYIRHPNTFCLVCGKPIYKRRSQIQTNNGRVFCSTNCYGMSNRKEKPCVVCGKPILASKNKITCSRECSNKHRTGIKYLMGRPRDKVSSYKILKVRLMKVRGKLCERCGYSKYEILQVHHRDRNHQNNEITNLELICPNCHFEEHLLEKSWMKKLKVEES